MVVLVGQSETHAGSVLEKYNFSSVLGDENFYSTKIKMATGSQMSPFKEEKRFIFSFKIVLIVNIYKFMWTILSSCDCCPSTKLR